MRIILVRHSKTQGNIERRYCGRTDDPLCSEGIDLAKASGIDLTVRHVYVSPLQRACQTAQIKFPNALLTVSSDLREMDFGDFEGLSAADLEGNAAYSAWLDSNCADACPNGEQLSDFSDRVCRAFDAIVQEGLQSSQQAIIIVAHGGSIMAILSRYATPQQPYYNWHVDNCCGFTAQLDDAQWCTTPKLTDCDFFDTFRL